jgi:6,7-dimethyl-8-ribityllumazine synthase
MKKILIINSNYYKSISNYLFKNATKKLLADKFSVSEIKVPGIFEIPIAIRKNIDFNKPIGNGIITALNMSQAINRSKILNSNKSNKGSEAANAVISILKNGPQKI